MVEFEMKFDDLPKDHNRAVLLWLIGVVINLLAVAVWSHGNGWAVFASILAVLGAVKLGTHLQKKPLDSDVKPEV